RFILHLFPRRYNELVNQGQKKPAPIETRTAVSDCHGLPPSRQHNLSDGLFITRRHLPNRRIPIRNKHVVVPCTLIGGRPLTRLHHNLQPVRFGNYPTPELPARR